MTIYTILSGESYTIQADSEEEALRLFEKHPDLADPVETRTEIIGEEPDPEPEQCDLCHFAPCDCDRIYDDWKDAQLERRDD